MNLYFGPAALHYIINNILSYIILSYLIQDNKIAVVNFKLYIHARVINIVQIRLCVVTLTVVHNV